MSAVLVVVLMVLVAGLPVALGCWYFRAKHAMALRFFFAAAFAGMAAVLLAAGAQLLVAPLSPQPNLETGTKWAILYKIFIEIATTEELARFLALSVCVNALKNLLEAAPHKTALVRATGMISGFSFAAVETIFFTMTNPDSGIIRAISAVPLHGACGIKAANAVLNSRRSPGLSLMSIIFAVALHGIYNFLVQRGGLLPYLGVALAVTALLSSAQSIVFEENDGGAGETPPDGRV
jgi:hypothetical protein